MTESSISAMLPFHITQPFTYLLIIPTYNAYHNMYSFLNLGLSNILATHYINRISFFFHVLKKLDQSWCATNLDFYIAPKSMLTFFLVLNLFMQPFFIKTHFNQKNTLG